ncbi:hypothetical protein [Prochlorococcus marinus]|uniref:hypothetical protein n=1 Tax=Prochlorococcus marinus TaxID=1219 RepID=UPI0022B4F084|nr:hypothetical protein [Prochlorococcus marinus]
MKKLVLVLLAMMAIPSIVKSDSYYLILSKKGTGLERIEMTDLSECEELGEQWSNVSGRHSFVCLEATK